MEAAKLLKNRHAWEPGVNLLVLYCQSGPQHERSTQEPENLFSVMMFGGKLIVCYLTSA